MRILHLKLENCTSCPYTSFVIDKEFNRTILRCTNRSVTFSGGGLSNRNLQIILEQPIDHALAEVEIPEWCPLPKIEVTNANNKLEA